MLGFIKRYLQNLHHLHNFSAAAPDSGSTLAPKVADGAPTTVEGFITEPDANGACRRTASEAYYKDTTIFPHGPPANTCRKFITFSAIAAFGLEATDPRAKSILVNTSAARLFAGIGYGFGKIDAQPAHELNDDGTSRLVLQDSLAYAGPGINGDSAQDVDDALVARWRGMCNPGKPFYLQNMPDGPGSPT